jgi:iron(II)-dependent oxidoreductase
MDEWLSHLHDARARLLEVSLDLDDAQWMGPRLAIVNPMRWEIGHVGWFQEHWVLRHIHGRASIRDDADRLYDSMRVRHDTRWDLPLPDRERTLGYIRAVLDAVGELFAHRVPTARERYFLALVTQHEDMHAEAFTYTRQTLAYPRPRYARASSRDDRDAGPCVGEVDVPGGRYVLGALPTQPFFFDNEKWGHAVEIASFRIDCGAVTNGMFAEFVESGGYRERRFWSDEGWGWRVGVGAECPAYWTRANGGGFAMRRYDAIESLRQHAPVMFVNAYEAEAYCAWRGRRLPTEAEWELAASGFEKRAFPWGDAAPTEAHANLDAHAGDPIDVGACAAGDSPFGCRQMIGNVWEWTATRFAPYPGFVEDPYKEYSAPWFATPHRVLRGGCWATRARLVRNTWRNFYSPDRRDVFAGFRTCAL